MWASSLEMPVVVSGCLRGQSEWCFGLISASMGLTFLRDLGMSGDAAFLLLVTACEAEELGITSLFDALLSNVIRGKHNLATSIYSPLKCIIIHIIINIINI